MEVIRWGIAGLGKIASRFAEDLQLLPGNVLMAVASRSAENARQFAAKYRATYWFNTFEALLTCQEVDAVYVAAPHSDHFPITMLALQHGKHVLCEKPMGINSMQVAAMQQLALQKGLFLMEALWTRYMPSFQKVLEWLPLIEPIGEITADFGFAAQVDEGHRLLNKAKGGGALLDVGIYPVFLALQLLHVPEHIFAEATFTATGVDASCRIRFEYPQKAAFASLSCSIVEHTPSQALIKGQRGTIHLAKPWHGWGSVTLHLNDREPIVFVPEKQGNGLWLETKAASLAIRTGKIEEPLMPHWFTLQLAQTLDAIRQLIGLKYEQDRISF
ncbi:MAG: Gfo/Idh/MocA family oxidoreductase [Cytophagales bacterium]|nr:Gfo/Idh/MocA family oxidoreductase [Bernardetiaceae bacterium]MDW8210262.1 Gfo/Idh/MocA family oxidoreductase [Cytophagales bacterium]